MSEQEVGFAPDEIDTGAPTRSARLKWVIVVQNGLPTGQLVNAAVCVAAATASSVAGLLGPGGLDAAGSAHAGLPWAGCTILGADAETLRRVRRKADAHAEVHLADMPLAAQQTRVYDEYLSQLAGSDPDQISYGAVSLVGPRKAVDRIVGGLKLLS